MKRPSIRFVGRDDIELDLDAGIVAIGGERLVSKEHRDGFWASASATWRWKDGHDLAEAERVLALAALVRVAATSDILLELDEPGDRERFEAADPETQRLKAATVDFRPDGFVLFFDVERSYRVPARRDPRSPGSTRLVHVARAQDWTLATGEPLADSERLRVDWELSRVLVRLGYGVRLE